MRLSIGPGRIFIPANTSLFAEEAAGITDKPRKGIRVLYSLALHQQHANKHEHHTTHSPSV